MKILFRKFYKSWYFDAVLVVLILIGVIYVLNLQKANEIVNEILNGFKQAWVYLLTHFTELITSDMGKKLLAGIVGSFILLVLIIWRIVYRLRSSKSLATTTCPNCESPLVRVKSKRWQKTIRPILPLRRFYCKNCGWKGFRMKSNDSIPLNMSSSKGTRIHVDKIS